jgi:hypothetical protein
VGTFTQVSCCERFIDEFKKDILEAYPLPEEIRGQFKSELGMTSTSGDAHVRIFRSFRYEGGKEYLFIDAETPAFFCADEISGEVVVRLEATLQMKRDEAIERLKKAKLIQKDFK